MADQTKRQGEWSNGKRVAWLSAPQETFVSGYGDQTGTAPTRKREKRRMYTDGKFDDLFKRQMTTGFAEKFNLNRNAFQQPAQAVDINVPA